MLRAASLPPMATRRLVLAFTTAVIGGTVALAGVPAVAQDKPADPTVYRFSIPGSVKPDAGKISISGDVKTKKSRGGKGLGTVSLADMVAKITMQQAQGHSVGGLITIKGVTRLMKGIPVLMDNGTVKIRVAQGRGSRALIVPRKSGSGSTSVCQSPNVAVYDPNAGRYVCKPV